MKKVFFFFLLLPSLFFAQERPMIDATYVVTVTAVGTTPYILTVHTKTSSDFKVRVFDATGAAVTSTSVTIDWSATDN